MTGLRTGACVRDALEGAMTAIAAGGSDTPRLDAELLLAHVLGVDRAELFTHPERAVEGRAVRAFQDVVRRRSVQREPVAYILGRKGFRYIEVDVDPRVLIPRPETELLVEVGHRLPDGSRVVDVATGSGAVALALKHERPGLVVTATDNSPAAVTVARANSARLGLDVHVVCTDLLSGVEPAAIDAILANPPYVSDGERAALPPDIARHEPPSALAGGPDGLDVIRRLVSQARPTAAGLLAIEVGQGQAPEVRRLMGHAGFRVTETLHDLAGIERVVVGTR